MSKNIKRKSNIEVLRVVLILMIIGLHYLNGTMGGELSHVQEGTLNYYISHICESLFIVAVNVFVIITGYFSSKKSSIAVSKIVKLFFVMVFWGIFLSLISIYFLLPQRMTLLLLKEVLGQSLTQWFVIIYIILYLLIPFLNKLINSITQSEFKTIILVGVLSFYVIGTISTVTIKDDGYGIINFINLYFIGAYIHKYFGYDIKPIYSISTYLSMVVLTTCFSFITGHAWAFNTIFNLAGSVAFFEVFKSINMSYNKYINKLATFTFSVYLIDVNKFFNKFLYHTLFHSSQFWNSRLMICNLLISIVGIYLICIVLDYIRLLVLGRLFDNSSNLFKNKIELK